MTGSTRVVNDDYVDIAPGQNVVIKSDYPVLIEFDRGTSNGEPARKLVSNDATLKVGVDPTRNVVDLFPEESRRWQPVPEPGRGNTRGRQSVVKRE